MGETGFDARMSRMEAVMDRLFALANKPKSYTEHAKNADPSPMRKLVTGETSFDRSAINAVHEKLRHDPSTLFFESEEEINILRSLVKARASTEPEWAEIFDHEHAHWQESKKQGFANPAIGIYYYETPKREVAEHIFCLSGTVPPSMDAQTYRNAVKTIALAPKNPSPPDIFIATGQWPNKR